MKEKEKQIVHLASEFIFHIIELIYSSNYFMDKNYNFDGNIDKNLYLVIKTIRSYKYITLSSVVNKKFFFRATLYSKNHIICLYLHNGLQLIEFTNKVIDVERDITVPMFLIKNKEKIKQTIQAGFKYTKFNQSFRSINEVEITYDNLITHLI